MKHYIIDGNNIIGKSKVLSKLQKKDRQGVREKVVYLLEKFFHEKKITVSLHFDGFQNIQIGSSIIKIYYSGKRTADEAIKEQIEKSSNTRNLIIVTSDKNLMEYAKVCSCGIINSDKFAAELTERQSGDNDETKRIEELKNSEEFKKLFGA